MKIIQSTVERLLYVILLVVFLAVGFVGVIAYNDGKKITQQQQYFHDTNIKNLQVIKANQAAETGAVKTYIACLLTLAPNSSTSIQQQEKVCFDKAPQIIK